MPLLPSMRHSTRICQDINPRTADETMARIQNAVTKLHTRLSIGLNNFEAYSNWRLFNHAYTVLPFPCTAER